jgi:hypothetical protein
MMIGCPWGARQREFALDLELWSTVDEVPDTGVGGEDSALLIPHQRVSGAQLPHNSRTVRRNSSAALVAVLTLEETTAPQILAGPGVR